MYQNCEAIVLRKYRYSETSYILHIFTKEFGRINALAKGARREKSPLNGHFDLYNLEEITIFRKRRSDLDLATGANLLQEYRALRGSAVFFSGAGVIGEIILKSCMLYDKHELAFDALKRLLEKSSDNFAKPISALVQAVWAVLKDLGFEPQMGECLVCGKTELDRFVLSPKDGGCVCKGCSSGKGFKELGAGELAGLRFLSSERQNTAVSFTRTDIIIALAEYVNFVLGVNCCSFEIFLSLVNNYRIRA